MDYSAKIKLIVDGLQSLKEVEDRVKNLNRLAAVDLGRALTGTKGFGAVKKEVDGVADSFSRLGKIVRGIAVGTGLGALTTSINGLSQAATALKFGGISKFAAALAAATGPAAGLFKELSGLAIQFPIVAGTATIAGAALLAFAPQVLRAGNATVRLAKAAAEAGQPLSRLMASVAGVGFNVDMFIDAAKAAEVYKTRLYELSETVSNLSRRQTSLQTTLNKFNSDSDTAAKIAVKLVDVTKRLNAEQQAQNDLLREAAGLRPESVERRATNTYNVTQRRKVFEAEQASDLEALNESLRRLENRQVNWADALGIDAIEGAALKADRLSQAWAKNQQALTTWESALREGGQWLKELQASMRTDAADAYTRALLNQQRTLDTYADSAAQARRAIEGLGYKGEAPALRPSGFTDQDVRIKNLLDDEKTAANTIFNIESEFNKKVHFTELEFIRKELEAEIDKIEAIGAAQKKADSAALKDFDARLATRTEKSKRRREVAENVVIGGAFPALFGGGLGTVAGGALGGFIPGNPMLSVATSAVGALVDQFIASVTEAGSAMRDPITNFQKLADAGLIASRSQKQYIERLIEAGRVTEAATAIQDELIKKIGVEGVRDLQNAGAASDKLNKAFAEFSLQAQAAIAGPLAGLLSWLADVVAVGNRVNREAATQTDIMKGLSAQDRAVLQREEQRILQGANLFNEAQKRQQVSQLYQSYAGRATTQRPGMSVDTTPELQAKGQTRELAAQVNLEAKKLSLVGMSLERNGQAYIAAAKAVALQEYENRLLEIKNSWIGKAYDAERNRLLITQANLQYAGKLKAIDAEQLKALKDQRDARSAILGLQAELLQTTIAAADIDVEFARLRGGEAAAIQEEVNQLNARFNVEAKILDLQTQQKLLTKDITTQEVQLINSIYKEQLANLKAQYDIRVATRQEALALIALNKFVADAAAKQQAVQPFEDVRRNRELEIQFGKTYLRLVTEGMLPAEAERIANFERLVAEQLTALDQQIATTKAALIQAEAYGASAEKVKELRQELERLQGARGAAVSSAAQGPGAGKTNKERLQEEIATLQGQLNTLLDPINQITTAAEGIGLAFSDSFKGIVSGTMTAQEALASFFRSVADHFLDMAAQIIAKWIQLTILNSVLSLFPGGPSVGAAIGSAGGVPGLFGPGAPDAIAGGAIYSGPGPYALPARAAGGPVTGGMPYMVGERGPELFVPGRSGSIVPNHQLGGDNVNVVVNVDAKGTSIQGNDQQGNQLGRVMSAAIQAELIKQKRPGGLLA